MFGFFNLAINLYQLLVEKISTSQTCQRFQLYSRASDASKVHIQVGATRPWSGCGKPSAIPGQGAKVPFILYISANVAVVPTMQKSFPAQYSMVRYPFDEKLPEKARFASAGIPVVSCNRKKLRQCNLLCLARAIAFLAHRQKVRRLRNGIGSWEC